MSTGLSGDRLRRRSCVGGNFFGADFRASGSAGNRFPLRFASSAQIALSTFLVKFNSTYSKSHDSYSAPELKVLVS